LAFFTSWANSPFAIAIGAVGVFALLQATGLLGLLAGGGEAGHDVDHDVDADADADADAHAEQHADGDHDADGGDRSLAAAALSAMGLGTIPLSMQWESFALAFGAAGIALNLHYFAHPGGAPVYTLAWTVPSAFAAGCLSLAALTKVLGPILSSKGQEATTRAQLVGQIGVVISSKVDGDFGEVRIRDRSGHDLRVVCKLATEAKSVPRERQNVVVVDCDDKGVLTVEPFEDEGYGGAGDAERRSVN
jgi:membrane protein implicated in regulation of membrane protease activity